MSSIIRKRDKEVISVLILAFFLSALCFLMAFAAKEAMDTFRQNLQAAYQNVSILYDEAVTT